MEIVTLGSTAQKMALKGHAKNKATMALVTNIHA